MEGEKRLMSQGPPVSFLKDQEVQFWIFFFILWIERIERVAISQTEEVVRIGRGDLVAAPTEWIDLEDQVIDMVLDQGQVIEKKVLPSPLAGNQERGT
jgi:hypothetical protein